MKEVKTPRNVQNSSENDRMPVQVFCRLRPLSSDVDPSCVTITSPTTVVLTSTETAVNYKLNVHKETKYTFKYVFGPTSTQRNLYTEVAKPLVENLIRGKNSLLFTYGVTGSGKTYTMTGDTKDRGIMPRCLDALFKTISDYQTKKFVFKPDRLNGFEILSDADAMLERQADMNMRFAKPRRQNSDPEIASQASADAQVLNGIDEDNMYSVFITYVEVYNNNVYDLLEEGGIQRTLQSKIIREDCNHNMFVHGVTEIEIKSVEEALEAFQIGQKRKRMGHTILNAESSRSHSIFTIRLVQAPTDSQGETVIQDKRIISVSQLSLVDLAGSERTNRTKNTGQRLREAGNINNSLMTLRTCLECLRENQQSGLRKKVPYRDSKLTHMFKNYFEGEGQVSMIVCINPRAEDYDETACVMKFAEMTQDVQTVKPTPVKYDMGLTPGRRKANKIFKTAINNLNGEGIPEVKNIEVDLGLVYSLGPRFPDYDLNSPETEHVVSELIRLLKQRIEKRVILRQDLNARYENLRMLLLQMEKENLSLRTEVCSIDAMLNQERETGNSIRNKVIIYENSIDELNRKLKEREEQIRKLHDQLNQKQYLLTKKEMEKDRQKKKLTTKMAVETDKMKSEYEHLLREQEKQKLEEMRMKDEKLRLVSNILKVKDVEQLPKLVRSTSSESISVTKVLTENETTSRPVIYFTPGYGKATGVPVANSRHRRSRSAGDKWLEHRAKNPVPLGTILQPYLTNTKSVTQLKDVKDVVNSKTTKYCLVSQQADTDGEVETKLYKGNVIPTIAGGAQVIFDDVECLKQTSPISSPARKRPSYIDGLDITSEDIASKCNVGIEGHSSKRSKV